MKEKEREELEAEAEAVDPENTDTEPCGQKKILIMNVSI